MYTRAVPALRLAPPDPDRVVADHHRLVWALCRRLDPSPEDAYQEAWEKVLRALPGFDPAGRASLKTWVLTIAHRHLVDRWRTRKPAGEVDVETLPDPRPSAPAWIDQLREARRLEAALQALPEAQRRVVVLHHLHDLPLDTIAAAEGVAVGTVKSRLHRGRTQLTELLR